MTEGAPAKPKESLAGKIRRERKELARQGLIPRGRGRPNEPKADLFLLYLSTLKDGPLAQEEICARSGLEKSTVSRYSNRYPSLVEKTPNGYSLTPSGQAELRSRELQQAKNRVMAAFERTNQKAPDFMAEVLELTEKRKRALKYLGKKADVVSRHPKFEGIQDPVLRARAVDAFLEGILCYGCLDPKIVNETGSLERFLSPWDSEGMVFCKRCGIQLFKGGDDIRIVLPRKRAKRAVKLDEEIGTKPDVWELRRTRKRSEAKTRGS